MTNPLPNQPEHGSRSRWFRLLPWAWLVLSAIWAVVIFVTDQVGWGLALWVATTLGPLAALEQRRRNAEPAPSDDAAA